MQVALVGLVYTTLCPYWPRLWIWASGQPHFWMCAEIMLPSCSRPGPVVMWIGKDPCKGILKIILYIWSYTERPAGWRSGSQQHSPLLSLLWEVWSPSLCPDLWWFLPGPVCLSLLCVLFLSHCSNCWRATETSWPLAELAAWPGACSCLPVLQEVRSSKKILEQLNWFPLLFYPSSGLILPKYNV